jgi:hypothetical protein
LWLLNFSRFREAVLASGCFCSVLRLAGIIATVSEDTATHCSGSSVHCLYSKIFVAVIDEAAATSAGTRT